MENKTVSSRMESLLFLYDMQTDFFPKVIVGISDEDAHNRLHTKANHIAWLAGSLVEQRYEIAKHTGTDLNQSAHDLFKNNQGIQDNVIYPPLNQYNKDWASISPLARNTFLQINDEKLNSEIEMGGMKMSLYDLIAFTIYREASCIGQIALWRRLLGYDALRYD